MLILLWSSDQEFVSHQTCGYRTRKPRLYLGGIRREGLHRMGFADIHTDAAGWFTERGNTRGLVTGPAQLALYGAKEVRACQLDWPGPEFGAFPN